MLDFEDITPIFEEKKEEEINPCDKKAMRWAYRMTSLIVVSVLLTSMTFVSWNKLNMYENDNETPTPMAMMNSCLNQSWNVVEESTNTFKIMYYTNVEQVFIHSNCVINQKMPYIYTQGKCCSFVIWNTI